MNFQTCHRHVAENWNFMIQFLMLLLPLQVRNDIFHSRPSSFFSTRSIDTFRVFLTKFKIKSTTRETKTYGGVVTRKNRIFIWSKVNARLSGLERSSMCWNRAQQTVQQIVYKICNESQTCEEMKFLVPMQPLASLQQQQSQRNSIWFAILLSSSQQQPASSRCISTTTK